MKKLLAALLLLPSVVFGSGIYNPGSGSVVSGGGGSPLETLFGTARSSPTLTLKGSANFTGSVSGSTMTIDIAATQTTIKTLTSSATFTGSGHLVQNANPWSPAVFESVVQPIVYINQNQPNTPNGSIYFTTLMSTVAYLGVNSSPGFSVAVSTAGIGTNGLTDRIQINTSSTTLKLNPNNSGLTLDPANSSIGSSLSTPYGFQSATATVTSLSASLPVQTDSNKFLTSAAIDLSGTQATGTMAAGREPAHTGDVTNSAGSLAMTAAATQANIRTFTAPITITSSLTVSQGIQTSTFSVTTASASFNNVPYVWPANTMVGATPLSLTVDSSSRIALSGSSGSGYSTVQDEGSDLTQRSKLNFIGSNIACVDNSGSSRTDCTLSAAGAGDAVLASTQAFTGGNTYTGSTTLIGSTTASGLVSDSSVTVVDQLLVPSKAGFTTSTNASIGFDSTRVTYLAGVPSFASSIPLISSFAILNQSLTNSTASDQDFVTISTIPANRLISGKCFRVTLHFQTTAGVSAVTASLYLKLGSAKMYVQPVSNWTDSLTRSSVAELFIVGTAAAGASVSVQGNQLTAASSLGNGGNNSVSQPVAGIATNGALGITPGITFSGTGSTETANLMFYTVQEMN